MITADGVWFDLVRKILEEGEIVRPRGLTCQEILSHTSTVLMKSPITTIRPRLGYNFLVGEAHWIISGRNDVREISRFSPHIASYSNDGVVFDGAYGPRIIDQLRYVCDCLQSDQDTRQAVIEIWRPNPRPSKDIPCTLTLQWMIRDGKLNCFANMRSSDAWLGWPYDVFNFSMLSAYIALLLFDRGIPRNSLELGCLFLNAASQHLYLNPAAEGANNIPYSVEDLKKLTAKPNTPHMSDALPYGSLTLDQFNSAHEFMEHLHNFKEKKAPIQGVTWLTEFWKPTYWRPSWASQE